MKFKAELARLVRETKVIPPSSSQGDDMNPVTITSILYVGQPAPKVLESVELKRVRQLRTAAHIMRQCGMEENARATFQLARSVVRRIRTCNGTIPRHRRVASLGWQGPVW